MEILIRKRRHYFFPALTFAHLARCAALIFANPAAEIRRFGARLEAPSDMPFSLCRRAFCAARILARALALNLRLRRGLVAPSVYSPANAASAAFSPFNCRVNLSRSAFNSAVMFMCALQVNLKF
jgi:hypothetical protein